MSLCHIGLVKDHGGHLVNQPCLSLFDKCWITKVGYQISTVRKTNKQTQNMWSKFIDEGACLCTQKNGSNLIEEIWCGLKNCTCQELWVMHLYFLQSDSLV